MRTRTKLHIPGFDVRIGDLVKDELSGFVGIVSCHTRNLTGCDTSWVISRDKFKKDSTDPEAHCFDLMGLVLVERNPMNVNGFPDEVPASG